jgi:hypothetical protein
MTLDYAEHRELARLVFPDSLTEPTPPRRTRPTTTHGFRRRHVRESGNPRASRRVDLEYVVAAGWLTPVKHIWVEVGRYRQVAVPLYRTGDVDALRELPWVDWEAVRACRPGQPSPLRVFAPRPPSRAEVIRRFVAQFADRYQVEVWAWYHGGANRWELDWEQTEDGEPTVEQVEAAIVGDPVVGQYRGGIELATEGGAAVRWARAMVEPGAAVILDTVIYAGVVSLSQPPAQRPRAVAQQPFSVGGPAPRLSRSAPCSGRRRWGDPR